MSRKPGRRTRASARKRTRRLALLALVAVAAAGAGAAAARSGALDALAPESLDLELPDVGAALRSPRFHLREVEFLGLSALGARDLTAALGLASGTPLVDVDPGAVCARLEALPRVARCAAARVPPGRLLVELAERVPLARHAGAGLDAEGARFPLAPGEAAGLPRVTGRAERALPLLRAARAGDVTLERVSAPEPGALWFRPAGGRPRVRVGRDPERALRDWRRLDASGLARARGAGEVDLRFRGGAVLRGFEAAERGGEDGAP